MKKGRDFMTGRWSSWSIGLFVLFLSVLLRTPGFAEERYTVKTGDSLYRISKAYGVSVGALKTANHLEKETLRLNQVLLIPASKEKRTRESVKKSGAETAKRTSVESVPYVVEKGDSLLTLSKRVGLSVDEIKRINRLRSDHLRAGQTLILSSSTKASEEPEEEPGEDEETPEETPEEGKGEKQEDSGPASGSWKNPEERNLFIRVVRTFLGVPYRLGGSTLRGIDCSAFVKKIYEIFNIELPRTTWEQFRIGKRVGKEELEEGDLVFFKVPTRRASNRHVGIYIGNNEFIHASSRKKEVRVDNLDAPYFHQRFINGVRVKELEGDL
jgi:peptidoglycan DL-endopeptidase LytE